jgi:hypothetical protein
MITIDHILKEIEQQLELSRETEQELLAEIRTHLEDAMLEAKVKGESEEVALLKVAEKFGVAEVGPALQDVHAPWESADAILACLLPVVAALVLRWLAFAPDGTALGWVEALSRPGFWVVAVVALLIPFLQFQRWRYALASWGIFWTLTIIFIVFPTVSQW